MVRQKDLILAGVQPGDVASLRLLAAGTLPEGEAVYPLEAKGWVEVAQGVPLITLTGRALLERTAQSSR